MASYPPSTPMERSGFILEHNVSPLPTFPYSCGTVWIHLSPPTPPACWLHYTTTCQRHVGRRSLTPWQFTGIPLREVRPTKSAPPQDKGPSLGQYPELEDERAPLEHKSIAAPVLSPTAGPLVATQPIQDWVPTLLDIDALPGLKLLSAAQANGVGQQQYTTRHSDPPPRNPYPPPSNPLASSAR